MSDRTASSAWTVAGPLTAATIGHLDVEQRGEQALAVEVDLVPLLRRHRTDPARVELADEPVAAPGEDHDTVLGIGADVGEQVPELGVRTVAPHERVAVGVQRHLEDAVGALETRAWAYFSR